MKTVRGLLHLGLISVALGMTGVMAQEEEQRYEQPLMPPEMEAEMSQPMEMESEETALEEMGDPLRVSMDFKDANIKDVLKTFSQQTGLNVIASQDIGDKTITLYLEDVSPLDALDQILLAGQLTYERPVGSDIYIVKPAGDGTVVTTTRVYQLRYARVSRSILAQAAAAFNAITPFESFKGLQEIGGGGGGRQAGGRTGGTGGGGLGGSSTSRLEDIGIDAIVKKLLTEHGEVVVDSRTNRLIVTDIEENFRRIEAALVALDVRTPQIMVDAEVLETTLTKLKDLGVEWGTGSEGTLFQLTPAKRTTRFPFSTLFGKEAGGTTSLTVGTFDTSQAVAVLQALERDVDTKILARPKILTLDNESAVIRLTVDQATGFQTTVGEATTTTTAEPQRTTTGVILSVTPQVNEDDYITMLVEPSVTKVVEAQVTPPTVAGGTVIDPKTRSARSIVRVRSGQTLVIGGLIDRSEEQTVRKVPVLSGIPFIGEAFKNAETSNTATELIVFLTPRLVEEAGAAEQVAQAPSLTGLREQEPAPGRQDAMESSLNTLEKTP